MKGHANHPSAYLDSWDYSCPKQYENEIKQKKKKKKDLLVPNMK